MQREITLGFNTEELSSFLKGRISDFAGDNKVFRYGTVINAADGVVRVAGLPGRRYGELLEFGTGIFGMTLELSDNDVGAVLLADVNRVEVGMQVRGTDHVVEVPIGPELLGRVVDPLGRPLDGNPLRASATLPVERSAPTIIDRQPVDTPMMTGLLAIDSMIPIGRGQRELIIGDRQTGKTTIAIDTILNQATTGVICVYCAIGQKASSVSGIVNQLTETGAMEHTVVVVSTASDSPAMQYIAPYAACSIAEGFMQEGKDVLVVYDDLSKHAVAYRTMSLLLQRPPGREAYPGDVFYLHSRLLERAAHLSKENGGGSITALPIIETMGGDISAYIPTNVISITDGQIFLETELFHSGVRPAVNVGLSVSRVGRAAQYKAMRRVAGTLRIDLAQFRELQVFTQFGSDVDASTRNLLERGAQLVETLKQPNGSPFTLAQQVCLLLAFTQGVMKGLSVKNVQMFAEGLLELLARDCSYEMQTINRTGEMEDDIMHSLAKTIRNYAMVRWGVGG